MIPPWLPMTPIFITESVSPKQMWMFENNQSSKSLFSTVQYISNLVFENTTD